MLNASGYLNTGCSAIPKQRLLFGGIEHLLNARSCDAEHKLQYSGDSAPFETPLTQADIYVRKCVGYAGWCVPIWPGCDWDSRANDCARNALASFTYALHISTYQRTTNESCWGKKL
jgi:hypothetical protein